MRVVVDGKISAFLLQAGKLQNKKISSFGNVHPHDPAPTEYFSIKSGQEMDFTSVIAVNFMC